MNNSKQSAYNLFGRLGYNKKDFKMASVICLYFMYKQKENYKFPQLYNCYGNILKATGKSYKDLTEKTEKYSDSLAV